METIGQARREQPGTTFVAPRKRLLFWFVAVALVATAIVALFGDAEELVRFDHTHWGWVKIAAIGATGVLAVLAAVSLIETDFSHRWVWIPLPMFLLWIGSCIADGRGRGISQVTGIEWSLLTGLNSAIFIFAVSVPLIGSLMMLLRRAPRQWPISATLYIGLGAAAISVFVMQFFHLHVPNIIDFTLRITAILIVICGTALFSQLCPAGESRA